MTTSTVERRYAPEDLLTMEDGDRYELVDGLLRERPMSTWSSFVAGIIHNLLFNHCRQFNLGWVFIEGTSFQCFANDPRMVRKPDVSFVRRDRLAVVQAMKKGYCRVAPDLAVEVLSPNDIAYEIDEKIGHYFDAGVRLVWVVNPEQATVAVHRLNEPGTILRGNDQISGEEVVPGFSTPIGKFFEPPSGAEPGNSKE